MVLACMQGSSSHNVFSTSQCRDHLVLMAPVVILDPRESRVLLELKVLVVVMVSTGTRDTQVHEVTLVHL